MRFLLDQCLPVELTDLLAAAGHDVVHLTGLGMQRAKDPAVLALAREQDRVLLSADTDFGMLLANLGAETPSVVLFRRATGRDHVAQAETLLANLDQLAEALDQGAVVVIEQTRIRVRMLPITG